MEMGRRRWEGGRLEIINTDTKEKKKEKCEQNYIYAI